MVEIFGALFFAHVGWMDGWMTWPRSIFAPWRWRKVLGLSCAVGWCIAGIQGLQAVFAYRESGLFYHFLLFGGLLKFIRVARRRAEGGKESSWEGDKSSPLNGQI